MVRRVEPAAATTFTVSVLFSAVAPSALGLVGLPSLEGFVRLVRGQVQLSFGLPVGEVQLMETASVL